MVCSFFIFVLPALLLRAAYAVWAWMSGRKQEKPVENNADATNAG